MTSRILPYLSPERILTFWQSVNITANPYKCWEWQKGCTNTGYGRFCIEANAWLASRLAYKLSRDHDPVGLEVLHTCDNPPCCNPKHLFLGTHYQNMVDREMKGRGRQPKGEGNAFAKLTPDKIREIRALYKQGNMSHRALAIQFGVAHPTIGGIIRRVYWPQVE